jgi:hypothetical protein
LSNLYTLNEFTSDLTFSDLYELGLSGHPDSSALRNRVAHHFHLSDVNTKKLYARLCALGIQKAHLKDIIISKTID